MVVKDAGCQVRLLTSFVTLDNLTPQGLSFPIFNMG